MALVKDPEILARCSGHLDPVRRDQSVQVVWSGNRVVQARARGWLLGPQVANRPNA